MAKQPDKNTPKPQRPEDDAQDVAQGKKPDGKPPQKTHLSGRKSQPTMLRKDEDEPEDLQADELEVLEDEPVVEEKEPSVVEVSDEVIVSELEDVAEAVEDVLDDIDVLHEDAAKPASATVSEEGVSAVLVEEDAVIGSSVIQVTEWAEDDEAGPDQAGSKVVVVNASGSAVGSGVVDIAEVVEDESVDVLGEELKASSSVIAATAQNVESAVVISEQIDVGASVSDSDVVMDSEEVVAAAPTSGSAGKPGPASTPPPKIVSGAAEAPSSALKLHDPLADDVVEEVVEEIDLVSVIDDDDAVDLGSGPAPEDEEAADKPPAAPTIVEDDGIDWDDLDTPEATPAGAIDRTIAFQDPGAKTDLITEEEIDASLADESSAVDLGGKKQLPSKPLSGVDRVAEALESGVNLDDEEPRPKKKSTHKGDAELFEEATELDAAAASAGKEDTVLDDGSGELAAARSADDEAAALFAADDDEESVKKPRKAAAAEEVEFDDDLAVKRSDNDLAAALLEDDDKPAKKKSPLAEAEAAEIEDEGPATKKKKGKKAEPALAGGGRGRGLFLGLFLGILLLGGGAAAVWYLQPGLLEDAYKASPNYVAPKKEPPRVDKVDPPSVLARAQMDDRQFDRALELLPEADKSPVNLSTRAEARWLKYLQDQTAANKPLSADDAEVKQVLADLKEANNPLLLTQVDKVLRESKASAELTAKNKQLNEQKAAVDAAEKARKEAEQRIDVITDALASQKLIENKDKFDAKVLASNLKSLTDQRGGLDEINKALKNAKVDEGPKGVDKLVADKKELSDRLEAIDKVLESEKVGKADKGLEELVARRKKLAEERDLLDKSIRSALKVLTDGGIPVDGKDPRTKIVDAVKAALNRAESPLAQPLVQLARSMSGLATGAGDLLKKGFDEASLLAELSFYRLREPLIETPERKMDTYRVLLKDRGRTDPAELALASKEAAWVLSKEAAYSPEQRAKALYVAGLAARNLQQFESARTNIEAAIKTGSEAKDADWLEEAKASLKELTDPEAYYLPQAKTLMAEGNMKAARKVLAAGLKAMPDNPRLLALRGSAQVEEVQGNRAKLASAEKEIRADIERAAKDENAAAEAAFLLGRLEEELGHFNKAEDEYRKAIKLHQGDNDSAARYIIALARLLQRDLATPAAEDAPEIKLKDDAEPNKDAERKKDAEPKKDASKKEADNNDEARVRTLLAAVLIGVQLPGEGVPENAASGVRMQESIDLAKKLLQSTNPKVRAQGHMLLGQALSRQGMRTEGIQEYVKGLELLDPGQSTKDIAKMLAEHPAFQQPDAAPRANPVLAEQFFGKGLHLYWGRKYVEAETEFKQALRFYKDDARYHYYLGLAMLGQKGTVKRDAAYYAFEQGARLEVANRPSIGEVNTSIERLQGPLRTVLDHFRQKALTSQEAGYQ